MPSNDELAARMAALQARMDLEAGLRASVDRDVAGHGAAIRATHHVVQALAITQGEHTQTLARHGQSLSLAHDKLDRIIGLLEPRGRNGDS